MDYRLISVSAALVAALTVIGCASEPPPRHQAKPGAAAPLLARFVDQDGNLTRAAMDQGLRKAFDAADLDHDGVLQADEVRPLNEARAAADPSVPRIIDWNGDGVISFKEFAAAPHALFDQLDRDGDDVLTPEELQGSGAGASDGPGHGTSGHSGSHRGRRSGG
ncbi:MAG: EF-hand domain-containing protein [Rhizomicrobium sp.]|nr:EF-hand domain-containing protein [Rhizomicrobium sp.]